MADLSRKRVRDAFTIRREPYWQRLAESAYLGFRRGPDTWVARYRDRNGKQQYSALGELIEYDEAKRRAEDWFVQLGRPAVRSARRDTVRAALEAYLADLRRHGREDTAREAEGRFELTVWEDPVANVRLEAATQDDFLEWRDRLKVNRLPRSVNRQVRAVVAGLNKANRLGHVGNPSAWTLVSLADDVEDSGETAIFLSAAQRASVIRAASTECAEFLHGLELTGARPKELAAGKAKDFDGKTLRLAHRKGRPAKLRVRSVVLSKEGIVFFKARAANKADDDFLFTDAEGLQWTGHAWSQQTRAAVDSHNESAEKKDRVPKEASAYSFRHARISELLQVHKVDPLTVAAQTGTSLAMIEKSYFRFIPSAMADKLASVREIA